MISKGFTLIELLITLAIVSILGVIAAPGYGQYLHTSHVKTAQGDLRILASLFEKRYQRVISYPTTTLANTAALEQVFPAFNPASNKDTFTFSSLDASNLTYTIRATGISGALSGCVISLNHSGAKSITNCDKIADAGEWL